MICEHCREPIEPGERAPGFPSNYFHFECGFRLFAGSVAHIKRQCCCFGGPDWHLDPPGMTTREAAWAALREYFKRRELVEEF